MATIDGSLRGMRISGAGNCFVLLDGISGRLPADPAAFAREACSQRDADGPGAFLPDGVLLLDRDPAGALRMVIHNADGTRPEACGNGLRCLAWYALQEGHAPGPVFDVATDAGLRGVRARRDDALVVEVGLGRATRLGEHLLELPGESSTEKVEAVAIQVGNPHLVLWRETLEDHEVEQWGALLEHDSRFEGGTNVEFAVPAGEGLRVRVWERGVGETGACGTGAGAAAVAAAWRGIADFPITVTLPGGELRVDRSPGCDEGGGELWLAGPVTARGAL
jgi:diaminopimelate epimerase